MMKNKSVPFSALIIVVSVITMNGCVGVGGGVDAFKKFRDFDIGKPISSSSATGYQHEIRYLEDGKSEYEFEIPEIGCRFVYIVNSKGIVLNWHYLSEPERCYFAGEWWGLGR